MSKVGPVSPLQLPANLIASAWIFTRKSIDTVWNAFSTKDVLPVSNSSTSEMIMGVATNPLVLEKAARIVANPSVVGNTTRIVPSPSALGNTTDPSALEAALAAAGVASLAAKPYIQEITGQFSTAFASNNVCTVPANTTGLIVGQAASTSFLDTIFIAIANFWNTTRTTFWFVYATILGFLGKAFEFITGIDTSKFFNALNERLVAFFTAVFDQISSFLQPVLGFLDGLISSLLNSLLSTKLFAAIGITTTVGAALAVAATAGVIGFTLLVSLSAIRKPNLQNNSVKRRSLKNTYKAEDRRRFW